MNAECSPRRPSTSAIARRRRTTLLSAALLAALPLAAVPALAQQEERPHAPSLPEENADQAAPPTDRYQLLEDRISELNDRLRESEEARLKAAPGLVWNGYVDFGFFVPYGNGGVGWIRDAGNVQFPQYAGYSWTFLGDILATAVNTRGEVADLGDAPGLTTPRFDSVNSDGAPGFIVNEVNLRPKFALTDRAILRSSINFTPRTGSDFALGDYVDVDLAEVEYVLTRDGKTSIFAGKMMPVFGIEYKDRKSDQRFGVTPSLVARYTTGSQLGLKIRSKLLNDWLIVAAAVTNNSSVIEAFHFASEIDKNWGKTLNGRLAVSIPIGDFVSFLRGDRLELGLSGEWGPQDRATNNDGKIWFAGADLQYLSTNFALKAQVLEGKAPGMPDAVDGVWGLDLKPSGYVEANWQALARFGFLLRAGLRDALVTLGTERIYVTKEMRFTGGVRVVLTPTVVLKAEYLYNREFGGIQQFKDDIFTSSLVLAF
jgi:hypothetical protein